MALRIDDGYQTLIDMNGLVFGVDAFEKEVTPPGVDGNGMVDITTMRNSVWRTRNAKHLKTLTEFTVSVAYSGAMYNSMVDNAQVNQIITVIFPEGSTVQFWGFIDKFVPQPMREGEQPIASMTVVPTNQNDLGVEVAPVVTINS
jgi:hypothetical protein